MSIKRKAFIGLATVLLSAGSEYYYFTNHFVPTTVVNASFTENFADLSLLMQNSDIIVKGTIKKEIGSFHPYPRAAYTDYVFEVTDLISGVLNENEITVTQKGGEVSFEDLNGKVVREKVVMDKHPLFQPGESYILFLNYSKEKNIINEIKSMKKRS